MNRKLKKTPDEFRRELEEKLKSDNSTAEQKAQMLVEVLCILYEELYVHFLWHR